MKQAQNSSYGWSKVRSHCTRREASATILHIIPLRPSTSANPWRDRHTRPRFAANWPTPGRAGPILRVAFATGRLDTFRAVVTTARLKQALTRPAAFPSEFSLKGCSLTARQPVAVIRQPRRATILCATNSNLRFSLRIIYFPQLCPKFCTMLGSTFTIRALLGFNMNSPRKGF